jgi:hypothetical protein
MLPQRTGPDRLSTTLRIPTFDANLARELARAACTQMPGEDLGELVLERFGMPTTVREPHQVDDLCLILPARRRRQRRAALHDSLESVALARFYATPEGRSISSSS